MLASKEETSNTFDTLPSKIVLKKLPELLINSKLIFKDHVSKLYKKASQKLHALAMTVNYMSKGKLKILINAYFTSQYRYCPLVWMFHSRKLTTE